MTTTAFDTVTDPHTFRDGVALVELDHGIMATVRPVDMLMAMFTDTERGAELARQGWRVAEFPGTGMLVFVRPVAPAGWSPSWSCDVWTVAVADIETVAAPVPVESLTSSHTDGRFWGISAELGSIRNRLGRTRSDNVRRVIR